jgi:hypothetical protein
VLLLLLLLLLLLQAAPVGSWSGVEGCHHHSPWLPSGEDPRPKARLSHSRVMQLQQE